MNTFVRNLNKYKKWLTVKRILFGQGIMLLTTSWSVLQFAIIANTQPFKRGGKAWEEKTKKCEIDRWKCEFRKTTTCIY